MNDVRTPVFTTPDEVTAQDQAIHARLLAQSGAWALTTGTGARPARRVGTLAALGAGLAIVLAIAVVAVLTVLIPDAARQKSRAAQAPVATAPAATPAGATPTAAATAAPATSVRFAPPLGTRGAAPERPSAATATPTAGKSTLLAGFEHGADGWAGSGTAGPATSTTSWAATGTHSLRAVVKLGGRPAYLARIGRLDLAGRHHLDAVTRLSATGGSGVGVVVKLYVQTGSDWLWTDGGSVPVTSTPTTVSLDLSTVAGRRDVRGLGVQFVFPAGHTGSASIFVDAVTLR